MEQKAKHAHTMPHPHHLCHYGITKQISVHLTIPLKPFWGAALSLCSLLPRWAKESKLDAQSFGIWCFLNRCGKSSFINEKWFKSQIQYTTAGAIHLFALLLFLFLSVKQQHLSVGYPGTTNYFTYYIQSNLFCLHRTDTQTIAHNHG